MAGDELGRDRAARRQAHDRLSAAVRPGGERADRRVRLAALREEVDVGVRVAGRDRGHELPVRARPARLEGRRRREGAGRRRAPGGRAAPSARGPPGPPQEARAPRTSRQLRARASSSSEGLPSRSAYPRTSVPRPRLCETGQPSRKGTGTEASDGAGRRGDLRRRRPGPRRRRSRSRPRTGSRPPSAHLRGGARVDAAVHLDRRVRARGARAVARPLRGALDVWLAAPARVTVMQSTWSNMPARPVTTSGGVAGLSASPAWRSASRTAWRA